MEKKNAGNKSEEHRAAAAWRSERSALLGCTTRIRRNGRWQFSGSLCSLSAQDIRMLFQPPSFSFSSPRRCKFSHQILFLNLLTPNIPPTHHQQQGLLPIGLPQRRDRRVVRPRGMEGEGLRVPDQEAREGGRGAPRHQDRRAQAQHCLHRQVRLNILPQLYI